MKTIPCFLLLFFISCAPRQDKTDSVSDSLATAADTMTAADDGSFVTLDTSIPDQSTRKLTWADSEYKPDLYIAITLDSMLMLLKNNSITDASIYAYENEWDNVKSLSFGNGSEIVFFRARDDSYYLQTADIVTPGFPFKHGLSMGMPRREAIAILGIDSTHFENFDNVNDTYTHEWQMGLGDFMRYTFTFDRTSFIRVTQEYENMD